MTDEEVKEMVEKHWTFLERWLHMIYVDAGIHFYGHGKEEGRKEAFPPEVKE